MLRIKIRATDSLRNHSFSQLNSKVLTETVCKEVELVNTFWKKFYNEAEQTFSSDIDINGVYPVNSKFKFVLWSVVIAVAGIADGTNSKLNAARKECLKLIDKSYNVLQKYQHQKILGAYTASEYFDGNNDIYYDDDAQVGSALVYMYRGTGQQKYLDNAIEVLQFLMSGYNRDPSLAKGGGMFWNYPRTYVNACTTSETALVALRVYEHVKNEKYLGFAIECIEWELATLRDPSDGLVWDGINPVDNSISKTKYSYNSGTLLSALIGIYQYEKTHQWLEEIELAVVSVLNHSNALFESRFHDWAATYWKDHSYFIQLLIEGLVDYINLVLGSHISLAKKEVLRHVKFMESYMYDPTDGLYFSSFQPYKISQEILDKFKHHYNIKNLNLEPDEQEREISDRPLEKRPLVKTLIGNGSAARILFLTKDLS